MNYLSRSALIYKKISLFIASAETCRRSERKTEIENKNVEEYLIAFLYYLSRKRFIYVKYTNVRLNSTKT